MQQSESRIGVRVTPGLRQRVEAIAAANSISVSDVARMAMLRGIPVLEAAPAQLHGAELPRKARGNGGTPVAALAPETEADRKVAALEKFIEGSAAAEAASAAVIEGRAA